MKKWWVNKLGDEAFPDAPCWTHLSPKWFFPHYLIPADRFDKLRELVREYVDGGEISAIPNDIFDAIYALEGEV